MADRIEVYVKKEKKLVGGHVSTPVSDGVMTHTCLSKKMLDYEATLSEPDKRALEVVNEFADRKGLLVEVIDVSTFKGKLRASLRGITKTPVVVAGRERIGAESSAGMLKGMLEAHFKQASV